MNRYPTARLLIKHGSHCRSANAGAARPSLSRAALPHAHVQFCWTNHLNKFSIDALREERVMFKLRTDLFQLKWVDRIDKGDTVRIAHRYTRDLMGLTLNGQRLIDHLASRSHGNARSVKNRLTHID